MTPQEHDTLALRMKSLAQQVFIDWLADLWRAKIAVMPKPEREATLEAMASKLQAGSSEYAGIALPWLDAAGSDMQSALFQEAYEDLKNDVLAKVAAGLTQDEEARLKAALMQARKS